MDTRIRLLQHLLLISCFFGCLNCSNSHNEQELDEFSRGQMADWNRKLTNVIVADIFTPPVASRIYAYPNIAAYESLRFQEAETAISFAGRLNGLKDVPQPNSGEEYYFPLAGIVAFVTVARKLVYNLEAIEALKSEYLEQIKTIGINNAVYARSIDFGERMGDHILDWANKDGYNERTALIRYQVNQDPGRWQPTPPDYMEAIEPHWRTIRTFVLDSANQFIAGKPTSFDTVSESKFYQEAVEVYETVKNLDEINMAIAKFWDCNPNISFTQGHVMYFHQQISPGGHWIHITAQVLEDINLDMLRSADVFSKVGVTIADAFISCWDEKYNSNLIRPETYINKYIDQDWKPILQTPAFPEHTSGHSMASSAAATMLTHIFGDNYGFTDSTEVQFGLPSRDFKSFYDASEEAAISRLYGGIHYMPAIESGVIQGKSLGQFVANKLKVQDSGNKLIGAKEK